MVAQKKFKSLSKKPAWANSYTFVYVCIRSHLPPIAQPGEEMVRGPRFELGTPRFSAGCLKWRRGHKSLRHNVGSSRHSCKSFTALHRVARGNVYGMDRGGVRGNWSPMERPQLLISASSAGKDAEPDNRGNKPNKGRPNHI